VILCQRCIDIQLEEGYMFAAIEDKTLAAEFENIRRDRAEL